MNHHRLASIAARRVLAASRALLGCAALCTVLPSFAATADGEISAVCSRTTADYTRTKLANGAYATEYYAFGEGGHFAGESADPTIDRLPFLTIARTLAEPLATQNYQPSQDPAKTKLLLMVYWGTTAGSSSSRILFHSLDSSSMLVNLPQTRVLDIQNARILGYDASGLIDTDYGRNLLMTAFRHRTTDLLDELADDRYFVIVMAFDFQLLWKEKKSKILWETRFSLREYRNDFGEALPVMAKDASRYFGQATHGLIRTPLRDPKIEMGELKSFGLEQPRSAPNPLEANRPALPPALAERIGAYDQEKAALQALLAATLRDQPASADTRRAIEDFNAANAPRIAALGRLSEKIRGELAQLRPATAAHPPSGPDQPLDTLRREFADDVRQLESAKPKAP